MQIILFKIALDVGVHVGLLADERPALQFLGPHAAGAAGLVDEYRIMCESALSVFRAGANMLITYYAKELAQAIQKGDIG